MIACDDWVNSRISDGERAKGKDGFLLWPVVVAYALITAYFSFCLIYRALFYYISVNSNEGWNGGHALRLFQGGSLYPDIRTFSGNNYPPVSFVMTALVMHIVPDPIFAGRIVALAGFLALPVVTYFMLKRTGCDRSLAVLGATVFPAYLVVNAPFYVAVDDPQLEAYAFLLAGAGLLLGPKPNTGGTILAACTITLGLFVKHNSVGIVLALAVWLFSTRPRQAFVFAAAGLASSAIAVLICGAVFGHDFFDNMLSPRHYSLLRSWQTFYRLDPALLLLGGIAAAMIEMTGPDAVTRFFKTALLFGLIIGLATASGSGVGGNAYFEIPMMAAPALAYGLHRLRQRPHGRFALPVLALLVAWASMMGPSLSSAKDMLAFTSWIGAQDRRQADTLSVVRFLADRDGPVLCQVTAYCVWAGKGIGAVAPFNFSAAVEAGIISDAPIVQRIDDRVYRAIVVPLPGDDSGLTPAITKAMLAHYKRLDMPDALVAVFVPASDAS